jgi:antitoxin HicB
MLMEKNMDIPAPGRGRGKQVAMVGLPSVIAAAKVQIYSALRASGLRKSELARRMGIHKQQVERLMDIEHTSRIEQLESASKVLGLRVVVDVEKAA